MPINSHILKLSGKCELPSAVVIGHNYTVTLKGSVVSQNESDNEDGTHDMAYTFKPVTGEVETDDGTTLKLKDNRSNSSLIRALIYKRYINMATDQSFDDFYDGVCREIMMGIDDTIARYEKK